MANFVWTGKGNDGNWYNADNWQQQGGGSGVPGSSDRATIKANAINFTITFIPFGGTTPVDPIVRSLNLFAVNGGTLELSGLTRYEGNNVENVTIEAKGKGSRIDLSDVKTLVGGKSMALVEINALDRGVIDLSGLTKIDGGTTEITADGVYSHVDLSSLIEFSDDSFDRSLIKVRNAGTIRADNLTTLRDVDLLSDNSLLMLPSLTTYTEDNNVRAINGGQICLDQLNDVPTDDNILQIFAQGSKSLVVIPESLNEELYVVNTSNRGRVLAEDNCDDVNLAPVLVKRIFNRTVKENQPLTISVANTFTDIDPGDSLTYSATLQDRSSLPSWLTFDAAQGKFNGTPPGNASGSYKIKLTATDEKGASTSTKFLLKVLDVPSQPPVVENPITPKTTAEDALFSFQVPANTFRDPENETLTYTTTIPNTASWLTFNSTTGTFSGTPLNEDVGSVELTVMATDLSGATVSHPFTLTVTNTNDAPMVVGSIPNRTVNENQPLTLSVTNTFTDIDPGDSLTYSATLQNGSSLPSWLTFDAAQGKFNGTPPGNASGDYKIKVTATDEAGESISTNFTLTVQDVPNQPPVVENPITLKTTAEDALFSFQVPANTFRDPENETLTHTAIIPNTASWLTFNPTTGTFSGTPLNEDVGSVELTVMATDLSGATASHPLTLTVTNTNDAPVVNFELPAQATESEQAYQYQLPAGLFTDVDPGDSLTYSASLLIGGDAIAPLPDWLSFDAATQTFSGTPTDADVGNYEIIIAATDESDVSVSTGLSLAVEPDLILNRQIGDQSNTINQPYTYQIPETTFSDADGDTLSYTVTLADGSALPDWLSFNANDRTLQGTPELEDITSFDPITGALVYDLRVTASDPNGASASDTYKLKVFEPNFGFVTAQYGGSYPDLILAIGASFEGLRDHYVNFGGYEGRIPDTFNGYGYLVENADVRDQFGLDPESAAIHYIETGFGQNRPTEGLFNPTQYIASYDDLIDFYGYDPLGGTRHYLEYGLTDNRDPFFFEPDTYIASHPDLITRVNNLFGDEFGSNIQDIYGSVLEYGNAHFIEYGKGEGRSRGVFDATTYLNNYADLQTAFGTDEAAATRHFIEYGYQENRIST